MNNTHNAGSGWRKCATYFPLTYLILLCFFCSCNAGSDKKTSSGAKGALTEQIVDSTTEVMLTDANGNERSIEQMHGSVVLMDVLYEVPKVKSPHQALLREVYDQFASQGLQIYQVCLSEDADAWRNVAKELPWTAVYDNKTLQSALIEKYKIITIPSMRLFDRNGKSIGGDISEKELKNKLKESL